MDRQLKSLDDTIAEIKAQVEKNPNSFLISTLDRLILYRENNVERIIEKMDRGQFERRSVRGGFRGCGIP